MKLKVLILTVVGLLLVSGVYFGVSAFETNNTNAPLPFGMNQRQNVTSEDHDAIFSKKIELTFKYLENYDTLSQEEKEQALTNFRDEMHTFVSELTDSSINYEERMFSRLSIEDRDLMISKRVELTLKYFSNYETMTDAEKDEAYANYQSEYRDFMQNIRGNQSGCQGFNNGGRRRQRYGNR